MNTTTIFQGLFSWGAGAEKLPMIRQSEVAECGMACLGMMAGYFGDLRSMHSLRRLFPVNAAGLTFYDMAQFASELGMQASSCELDLDDGGDPRQAVIDQLGDLGVPAILHWDAEHFVVLNTLKKERVLDPESSDFGRKTWVATVHDPALGVMKYGLSEFMRHFTGYVMLCEPLPEFRAGDRRELLGFSDLWSKIHGFAPTITLVILLSVVLQLVMMSTPYFLQSVLDHVLLSADRDLLTVLTAGFVAVALFERVAGLLRGFSLNIFNTLFSVQLKTGLYRHLLRLPQQFFENRSVGDTLSRFYSLDKIQDLMVNGLVAVVLDGITGTLVLGLMWFYNPTLTLIVLGMLAVYLMIQWLSLKKNREFVEKIIHQEADLSSQQIETLRAMQTLKLYNAQSEREQKWVSTITKLARLNVSHGNFKEWINQSALLIKGLMHVVVVYLGATMVMSGEFSVGMFLAFLAYRSMLADSLSNLIGKLAEFKLLDVHLERVSDVVCTDTEDAGDPPSANDPALSGAIELRNVSFCYGVGSARKEIVHGLSIQIKAGESVAIVGPSGSGKTTVMKLMLGLLTPDSGEVYVDNGTLQAFGLRKFRAQIATVMQDDQLLSGSIMENIVFFTSSYDPAWAEECARAACIYDDVMAMPMQWQSLVGDMGSLLSGGQKQRLLLARALYKKPRIIFMDEATSHLDQTRESAINAAMQRLSITRVIIAHRQETIESADRIFHLLPQKNCE